MATAENDGAFVVLARAAFDVMARRKWGVVYDEHSKVWFLHFRGHEHVCFRPERMLRNWACEHGTPDPFTVLIEADNWYRDKFENVTAADTPPPP